MIVEYDLKKPDLNGDLHCFLLNTNIKHRNLHSKASSNMNCLNIHININININECMHKK